jgi:hypothetical protein
METDKVQCMKCGNWVGIDDVVDHFEMVHNQEFDLECWSDGGAVIYDVTPLTFEELYDRESS